MTVATLRKADITARPKATHPPRPAKSHLDIKASHERISKRYPKILAELAK